jgi:hypothetical protein
MKNTFYHFSSKGYLNTMSVAPVIAELAYLRNDRSPDGGINIREQLLLGEYPAGLEFPVEYIVKDNGKMTDVLEMRWPGMFLISDHVKQVFEENGLTGWKAFDVVVWKRGGEQQITGYNGFTVTGRLPEGWDSDDAEFPDFFNLRSTTFVICTPKVRAVLKENKIKCFEVYLIDKEDCESIIKIGREFCHKKDEGTIDEGSVFFEKIHESLMSADQPEKGKAKK